MPRARKAKPKDSRIEEGRVRVHDPFELIRWLALSQPDPRKALAELVQNSLDASAAHVRISRVREKKLPCLKIRDDGAGVIPELDRPDALRHIATHIGHSRKRSLSPQERLTLLTQGQYGIGLLGFWSLGEMLEIRSSVPGQKPYRLTLYRDRPEYKIEPLRGKLPFEDERWTEVVVVDLHQEAVAALAARRAADYLASELRGQLLGREVEVHIDDKMARGRAPKSLRVRPPRFLGERIEGLDSVDVPGHAPARLELYLADERGESAAPPVALYAAGTIVTDRFVDLAALELDREPWIDERLTGMVDFPELRVAPGSRRGVIPDAVARAFADALRRVEPLLEQVLETKERERAEQLDRNAIRDLQRAFRDFYRSRPRYTMLPTEVKGQGPAEGEPASEGAPGVAALDPDVSADAPDEGADESPGQLFPPGPLDAVEVVPGKLVLEVNATKRVRAQAKDETGRSIREGVDYAWELEGTLAELEVSAGPRTAIAAGETPGESTVTVVAREPASGREVSSSVPLELVEGISSAGDEGIPEPELVDAPGASWRSRLVEDRWQVNTGHSDYKAAAAKPALKLRYLAMLFAKEVVLRSSHDPRLDEPLEQMVEVAAYADRRLSQRPPRGRRGARVTPKSES